MRSILVFNLLVSLILYFSNGFAQSSFKIGINAGVSASQVHGDTYSGFDKAGGIFGIYAKRSISEKWDAKFEINFIQKGSRKNAQPDKGDYTTYLLRLNYIEVPVLFRWHQKKIIYEFGPAFAFLVHSYEYQYTIAGQGQNNIPFNKTDFTFALGMSYVINDHWEFNARYTNSYIPVRTFPNNSTIYYPNRLLNLLNRGFYNNVVTLTLHYQL